MGDTTSADAASAAPLGAASFADADAPGHPRMPLIGHMMLARRLITESELDAALEDQRSSGRRIGEILVDMGALSAVDLTSVLAERHAVGFVDLDATSPNLDPTIMIPEEVARRYNVLPIVRKGDRVVVAMAAPDDVVARDDLRYLLGSPIQTVMAEHDQLRQAIDRVYERTVGSGSVEDLSDDRTDEASEDVSDDAHHAPPEDGDAEIPDPIARSDDVLIASFVSDLFEAALGEGASDIHIEPFEDVVRLRFRTDGVLRQTSEVGRDLLARVVSHFKALANVDVAQRDMPADGRFALAMQGKQLDVRVATIPTPQGESMVLRLLDTKRDPRDLKPLDLEGTDKTRFASSISVSQGGILVSGPEGSGRTSTIYSTLLELNRTDRSVVSIEDPVECQLLGVKQVQIDPGRGLTYASALRSTLRADPDVVMLGEIAGSKTAKLAFDAAITGRLVLSSVHSTSAATTPLRLIDMGVDPHVLAAALTCVVGQRLVRKLCEHCAVPDEPSPIGLRQLGCTKDEIATATIMRAIGCPLCHHTGYNGRTAIYEVMVIDDYIARLIVARASARKIERHATEQGMTTLKTAALRRLLRGELSVDEMQRAVTR